MNGISRRGDTGQFGFAITPSLTQLTKPEAAYCPGSGFLMTRVVPNNSTLLGVYSNHAMQDYTYQTLHVSSGAAASIARWMVYSWIRAASLRAAPPSRQNTASGRVAQLAEQVTLNH